jgi:cyanophycinase
MLWPAMACQTEVQLLQSCVTVTASKPQCRAARSRPPVLITFLRPALACSWFLFSAASGQPPQAATALPAPQFLIGGALHTCTSTEPGNCLPGTIFPDHAGAGEIVAMAANSIAASTRILQAFLQTSQAVAGRESPQLSLVTASSVNAIESVDFYRQLFEQLGFRGHWLPVDATLATVLDQELPCETLDSLRAGQPDRPDTDVSLAALQAQQLAFCRDPSAELALLREADAVFFNGGDQSLTLQSLVTPDGADRPWLALIRQRHEAGQLVLGGTSAGTAVHSNAEMLMGGDSTAALRHGRVAGNAFMPPAEDAQIDGVLFYPMGSGLFEAGILDSHFSERGRWLRLLILLRESRADLAFGVDETTALVTEAVATGVLRLRVVGEAGVVILQRVADGFHLHYLVEGNTALLQDGRLTFSDVQPVTPGTGETTLLLDEETLARDALRRWLSELITQNSIPQRAVWRPELTDVPDLTLDFSSFALLPSGSAGATPGFHSLLLRWY